MRNRLAGIAVLAGFGALSAPGQQVPIYQVKVIERTVDAVNYQYRGDATRIDFRGTVLMPQAKGDAQVQSKRGRTRIDARFSGIEAPARFGRGYLTYVLWAVTPEGGARNLGEVIANASDHAHIRVTTDLQAFGMIVTAEPYSAVRRPSDVVVLENKIREDTVGRIELIHAKVELLPRGSYTYDRSAATAPLPGRKVSMKDYESLLELYQAQNAIQIARAQDADRYAATTLAKADTLLGEARQMQDHKGDRNTVVTLARQAAETAEDARTIASRRSADDRLARAQAQLAREQNLRESAEEAARQARMDAERQQQKLEKERAARRQAEDAARQAEAAAQTAATHRPAGPPPPSATNAESAQQRALRSQLLRQMSQCLPTLDSPRGLVAKVSDDSFRGDTLDPVAKERLARLAGVIAAHPELHVRVEGYSDDKGSGGDVNSQIHADIVRDALVHAGIRGKVDSEGLGASRPIAANSTPAGKRQNRRVEVVVAGNAIGRLAGWDHAYSLLSSRR